MRLDRQGQFSSSSGTVLPDFGFLQNMAEVFQSQEAGAVESVYTAHPTFLKVAGQVPPDPIRQAVQGKLPPHVFCQPKDRLLSFLTFTTRDTTELIYLRLD